MFLKCFIYTHPFSNSHDIWAAVKVQYITRKKMLLRNSQTTALDWYRILFSAFLIYLSVHTVTSPGGHQEIPSLLKSHSSFPLSLGTPSVFSANISIPYRTGFTLEVWLVRSLMRNPSLEPTNIYLASIC